MKTLQSTLENLNVPIPNKTTFRFLETELSDWGDKIFLRWDMTAEEMKNKINLYLEATKTAA